MVSVLERSQNEHKSASKLPYKSFREAFGKLYHEWYSIDHRETTDEIFMNKTCQYVKFIIIPLNDENIFLSKALGPSSDNLTI